MSKHEILAWSALIYMALVASAFVVLALLSAAPAAPDDDINLSLCPLCHE